MFFDYLTSQTQVISQLSIILLDPEEKNELVTLVDEIYHYHILNLVLDHLPQTHHQHFVEILTQDPTHPRLMTFLKSHTTVDIEAKIRERDARLRSELISDIKKSKQK